EIAGAAAIFRDGAPGELQPVGMFVNRGDKRVDVTAAVPKLEKLALFFRLHRDQVRIGIEKLTEGGPKFFGVQLREIDKSQIMFTESELPDNLARRRIAQLGGKHNGAEDILAFCSRVAQRLTPCLQTNVRPRRATARSSARQVSRQDQSREMRRPETEKSMRLCSRPAVGWADAAKGRARTSRNTRSRRDDPRRQRARARQT